MPTFVTTTMRDDAFMMDVENALLKAYLLKNIIIRADIEWNYIPEVGIHLL